MELSGGMPNGKIDESEFPDGFLESVVEFVTKKLLAVREGVV